MARVMTGNTQHVRYAKSEGQKFKADTSLTVVQCYSCGVTYAIPTSFYNSLLRYSGDKPNGWKTVCPFGHEWWFTSGQTEEEILRESLERERRRAGRLASERDQAEASRRAHKAAATRARNQRDRITESIQNGVCPVPGCHRSFKNVRLHIAKKHPDFLEHEHGDG